MQFYTLFGLVAVAAALPSQTRQTEAFQQVQPWIAAGAGDSRGPCPMMNTLANHGYLPRSGRNITVEMFGKAVNTALGWSDQVGIIPANGAFKALGVDVTRTINLEQLNNRTSGLERPASLARADDSNDVVPSRVVAVLNDSPDKKYINAASLGRSRHRVELHSPLTATQQSPAQGEAGFVLALMLDGTVPAAGINGTDYTQLKAFKNWVQEWLTFERLPAELGWKRSTREVSLTDLAPINAAIKAAQIAASN
ncbi:hypothetical protein E8E13_011200 [Curvularia kusanoi]|uniref:Heme haloperoxidase family profile domain-containing protein n=1 Tax=Curvularia kusanoi TaxID=90978 RepID=A0A9P4TKI5_CURKU|nr:hypothetical protein E8E13_011200 [Curvularia kusanoi]